MEILSGWKDLTPMGGAKHSSWLSFKAFNHFGLGFPDCHPHHWSVLHLTFLSLFFFFFVFYNPACCFPTQPCVP